MLNRKEYVQSVMRCWSEPDTANYEELSRESTPPKRWSELAPQPLKPGTKWFSATGEWVPIPEEVIRRSFRSTK